MMKYVVTLLFAILVSTPSLAKMTSTERVFQHQKQLVLNTQTRTKSVLVHALPKAQRKFVVINDLTDPEDDDLPGPDELDLQTLYRRPRIVDDHSNDGISEYAMVRLAVARARAMAKYREMNT